jgi:hypothetical protein
MANHCCWLIVIIGPSQLIVTTLLHPDVLHCCYITTPAGEVVAAKTQEAAAKVADAASEVAQKAKHDAAELAAVTKEAFSSSDAPSAPVAEQ